MSLASRLAAVERAFRAERSKRFAYSHAQLLRLSRALKPEEDPTEERILELVGEPEEPLEPDQPSHAEALVATLKANKLVSISRKDHEAAWSTVYRACLAQLIADRQARNGM